jgi:hypothetical protein
MKCTLKSVATDLLRSPLIFWKDIQNFSQNLSRVRETQFPTLDPTTPWYEWHSYLECCASLGMTPSLRRFMAYNAYFKSVISND